MPLEPGSFRIQTKPPSDIHPDYATAEERETPVLVSPRITPFGIQMWEVSLLPDGQWTITAPGGGGWGRAKDAPGEDVLFTNAIKHWIITPHEDGGCVISIPATGWGVIWAATVEDGHLVIKSYGVAPDVKLPTWWFVLNNSD
ncbi:hypothetical protein H1R20_g10139, partial [Candolleomyces eurysporus]